MNEAKFLDEGYTRSSNMLFDALELCRNRASLAMVLQHQGVIDSRFGPAEEWTRAAGGIVFRLRPSAAFRKFGERPYFHRLEVACPCCGKWVPAGRLHQHARTHVAGRLHRAEAPLSNRPTCCIYPPHWYLTADGDWRRRPSEFQRGFHTAAGF